MGTTIPIVIEELYRGLVPGPNPAFWPEYLRENPVEDHGLWSFYHGLQLGLQLAAACLETP